MNLNQKEIKKRIKKRLSLILSLLLIISSINISSAAKTRFADVPDTHWASKVIAKWSGEDYNVLQGDSKGNFNPSKGLTLGEIMTVISKTFGYVQKQETQVTPAWAKESVEKAVAAGIIPKTEKIDANKMITRQEAIKYIAVAFGIQGTKGNTPFIDDQDIDKQYKGYIKAFYDMGYITGDNKDKSKAKFNPKAYYTRAQAMQVIDNILSDIIDRYTRDQTYEKNIIIRKAGVNLHNIKTKQNIIIAQGVQDSNISIDKVQIGKSLIIYGGKDITVVSDKMIENTIINRPYKSVTLRGIFNTVTVHDKTTVHIIGKAEKIILLGSAKATLNGEEVVQTKDDKNQAPSKSTKPITKTPSNGGGSTSGGNIIQGSTGTIPSITVTTKFPTETLSDSAIDIKYIATPSKGASIKEVTYTINDNFTEYLYYASENENERKGTLGQGRVLLQPGQNKIVFTVTDTAGKSGKYIVNQQPTFAEGTYAPKIKDDELSDLSDGSGKFVNNRLSIDLKKGTTKEELEEIANYVDGEVIEFLPTIGLATIRVAKNTDEGLKNICNSIKNKYSQKIKYAGLEIYKRFTFDSVDTSNNTDTKNNNPTIKKQDSVGAKSQGSTGTIPSITVTTKFPTETLTDGAIDIKYVATPSKGASIKEVTYTINDNFTEYLYYASENENEKKGTLGQGRVLLQPGPNKIVFTVTDTAGKSGKYIVNQQPKFSEGTYTPRATSDELSYLSDGSGKKFANNRIRLDLKDGVTKKDVEKVADYLNGEIIGYLPLMGIVTIRVPKNTEYGLKAICNDAKSKYPDILEGARIEIYRRFTFDGVDKSKKTDTKNNNPTIEKQDSVGDKLQGGTGTIPSITVTTKFPTETLTDSAIDIKYIATPSKGETIKEVTYAINDNFTEYLYYASENENEKKGTLGQGRVLLQPGPNKIVFTVTDTAGKSGKYIVNQQPKFSEGTYTPRATSDELSYLSDGSGKKFANNRIRLDLKDGVTKKDVEKVADYLNGEIIGYLPLIGMATIKVQKNTEEGLTAICNDVKSKYPDILDRARIERYKKFTFDN